MAQWQDYTTGQRIKLLRGKEITQSALAEMTGLSLPTIRAAERDKTLTLTTVTLIAEALGTDVSTVIGQASPRSGSTVAERKMLRRLSHAVHDAAAGDLPDIGEPAPLGDLAARVSRLWDLYDASEYLELGRDLPELLAMAYSAHAAANLPDREAAAGVVSDAATVAAYLANQLGARDLAYSAAVTARIYAKASGDPLRLGRVEACRSWIYRRDHRVAESLELVGRAAAELRPSYATASADHLVAYGTLVNHAAVASSRVAAGRPDAGEYTERTRDYLSQAHSVGARLGREHRIHGSVFGPATAAVKAVDINVHIGEVRTALDLVATIPDLSELTPAVRRRYELDKALVQAKAGQWDASLDTLETVCEQAPHWARHQSVPGVILQSIGTQSTARLRHIASLVGVRAVPRE